MRQPPALLRRLPPPLARQAAGISRAVISTSSGSAGIHAVAVSAAMKAVSAHLIDSRSVVSARHVAWSPDGVYALSGRNLLSVGGSRAKVIADSVSTSAIGWCGSTGRLYCVTGATLLRVRSPDGSWHSSVLPGSAQYSVIGDGHRLLLCSATHILAPPRCTRVTGRCALATPSAPRPQRCPACLAGSGSASCLLIGAAHRESLR